MLATLPHDIRHAVRGLRRQPGFTLIALLTLALGIGANTAVFSVLYGVLLRPLPYPESGQLVTLTEPGTDGPTTLAVSAPELALVQQYAAGFQAITATTPVGFNINSGSATVRASGLRVTHDYFRVLGIQPSLGRGFLPEEDVDGGPNAVVLSHGFWQRQLAGRPEIVGQSVVIDGAPYAVIGVMPAGFQSLPAVDAWSTMGQVRRTIGSGQNLQIIGRLTDGVSLTDAAARQGPMLAALSDQVKRFQDGRPGPSLAPYQRMVVEDLSTPLQLVGGAIALVLLIACANVASLILGRGAVRGRELAVRTALGASRSHLVRLLLVESLTLALAGGALGLLCSVWGLQALRAVLPADLPRADSIQLDGWALLFTFGISLVTGVLVGLVPAWQLSRTALHDAIKQGAGRVTARDSRWRSALVAGEIALALMLLTGAGLLIQTFSRLIRTDPGFDPQGVVSTEIWLTGTRYQTADAIANFYADLEGRLRALPGVTGAAVVEAGQPLERGGNMPMRRAGTDEIASVGYRTLTPTYPEVLGVPLREGRLLAENDREGGEPVVLVNEAFAHRFFADGGALGQQVTVGGDGAPARRIVGVIGNLKSFVGFPAEPTVFFPSRQTPARLTMIFSGWFPIHVVVRTTGDPDALRDAIVRAIQQADPAVPVGRVRLLTEVLRESLALQQFVMLLLGIFATLAAVLAAVGIYGVISYLVVQRTQEMGVRMALGARPRDVFGLVIGRGLRLTVAGVVLGLLGSLALTRVLQSQLYQVKPNDPATLVAVTLLFGGVALLACWIPARRATRVDPLVAMRSE